MTLADRLQSVRRLFLDTAPVIYYVEENARYLPLVETVFDRLDTNAFTAVTSPVTLAECLVAPYRSNETELRQVFADDIVSGSKTEFVPIDRTIADKAGELRARHNLTLTDAFQIATAAIQRAVNDVRDYGLVCFFPEGTFLISDTISCEQQVRKLDRPKNTDGRTQHYWDLSHRIVIFGSTGRNGSRQC